MEWLEPCFLQGGYEIIEEQEYFPEILKGNFSLYSKHWHCIFQVSHMSAEYNLQLLFPFRVLFHVPFQVLNDSTQSQSVIEIQFYF